MATVAVAAVITVVVAVVAGTWMEYRPAQQQKIRIIKKTHKTQRNQRLFDKTIATSIGKTDNKTQTERSERLRGHRLGQPISHDRRTIVCLLAALVQMNKHTTEKITSFCGDKTEVGPDNDPIVAQILCVYVLFLFFLCFLDGFAMVL